MTHRKWIPATLRVSLLLIILFGIIAMVAPNDVAFANLTESRYGELDQLATALLAARLNPQPGQQTNPAIPLAVTNLLRLRVQSARASGAITQGQAIPNYKFVIVRDDTGTPGQARTPGCSPATDANYPANCDWPSIHAMSGGSAGQVVSQGNQTNLSETTSMNLPNGKYMISVLAEGFKIDGQWFTVPLADPGLVTVSMQPFPLPLGTLRIQVFEDSMTNGQYDPNSGERGLAGFVAHLNDVLGEVTTDWFGNPLCTQYDANHNPIPGSGGRCVSDANGLIAIPNLGPNRYAVFVVPPNGQTWIQTTTLEGGHDWDVWLHENYTGYNAEVIVGGAQVPEAIFGYVAPKSMPASAATAHITGRAMGIREYVGQAGGSIPEGPLPRPWVALTDLLNGDVLIYAGQGNADGTFDIPNVPNGDYQIALWDAPQNYLLAIKAVTVVNGQTTNVGDLLLAHWFSTIGGTVFIDTNENGKRDPGEVGLPNYGVVLKSRENSLLDQGNNATVTNNQGFYSLPVTYEYGWWTVLEAYNDRFYTTGVTWQTDNQPTETTVLGAGVDVAVFHLAGLRTRVDWGVLPYKPGTNGGIVGTVVYNATRNELDARFAATEDYEGGIPGLTVNLYAPIPCTLDPNDATCVQNPNGLGGYRANADGSLAKGPLLNTYLTETFERPKNCTARTSTGAPLPQAFLPPSTGDHDCIEAPVMGNQVQEGFSSVNGNYGFTTILADPTTGAPIPETAMPPGDYLVEVVVPNDAFGRPLFQVSKEEDINVFDGDEFAPQVPPPPCVGPMHTVHVVGDSAQALFDINNPSTTSGVYNPNFLSAGGSPYEGQRKPLCNMLMVTVQNGRSIAPIFSYFTDVPLPGRLFGTVFNDLALSVDPQSLWYGEKAGIPNIPVGIYDYSGRYITTLTSDPNGVFEILLPSTSTYNCPLPAGPCPGMYRLVGNDPGQPGRPNPNYDPRYRTLVTNWQIWPNLTLLADAALVSAASVIEFPGTQNIRAAQCLLDPATTPQIFAVSQPYVNLPNTQAGRTFTINGQGFGATKSDSRVMLGNVVLDTSSWNDRQIVARVPEEMPRAPHQLRILRNNGQSTVNGLTFHVRGTGYNPTLFEVGPGKPYTTVQAALNAAANTAQALVVVYPNTPGPFTPLGDYYENIVIHSPVKLQGVGPGGTRADGTSVPGSILNGLGFTTNRAAAWQTLIAGLQWSGNQNVYEGQVIYVLAQNGEFTAGYRASIDGLMILNGEEFGTPGPTPAFPAGVATQGGGIMVNAFARNLNITNNVIWGNGGGYGGAIRVGTPYIGSNNNNNLRIANNRILNNGGANLAGAVAIFAGANNYEIANNDICGNFSVEYGGGISHFGLSPSGSIHHNRIYFNESYDEGAGIMIAGELPQNPAALSPGSGAVDIHSNIIEANLANDDGGGIRFLMAGNFPINVYNNMIVNNVSTHEGGGIAIDDTSNLRIYNNTIMKNLTTSTAATSLGQPMPAGLSTMRNSTALQATLPAGSPIFSNPLLFNNIFADNRAGSWNGTAILGIGQVGDATPINYWDLGVVDGSGLLSPTNSVLQQAPIAAHNYIASVSNLVGVNPQVVSPYDVTVAALPWRGEPNFIDNIIVARDVPANQMGNYHIQNTSPAVNAGAAQKNGINAPNNDIDGNNRPSAGGYEIGADEIPGATVNANLSITQTDGQTSVAPGSQITYTITTLNAGPTAVTSATVTDNFPVSLSSITWTCSPSAGSSCGAANGSGNINTTVNLLNGGTATFIARATFTTTQPSGTLVNTATVGAPAGINDPNLGNNSATDTDSVVIPLPAMSVLDNFNRANANTLGANWSQAVLAGSSAIRVNNNRAYALLPGIAIWNGPGNVFGNSQGAAFTFANAPVSGALQPGLILKASGGTTELPANGILVTYQSNQVRVATTTNGGGTLTTRATFAATFASGNTLSAVALANGMVNVYKTAGSTTTLVGSVTIPTSGPGAWTQGTGGGRIGLSLPINSRVDNFSGGDVNVILPAGILPVVAPTVMPAQPTATLTPTRTVTPTVAPSATRTVTPTVAPAVTITPTRTITPSVAPSATPTRRATPNREPSPTIKPSPTPRNKPSN